MKEFLLNINNISEKAMNFEVNASLLPNVSESLADKSATNNIASVALVLKRLDKSSVSITGTISLKAELICGICLEPIEFTNQSELDIILTRNNKQMPDRALFVENDIFNLLTIIDEDLIVEIPYNPKHLDCKLHT